MKNAMANIFGARLKEIRKAKNMSQAELAEAVGTSQSRIADYEAGKTFPTVPVIIRIAKFLNVSADYLLGLTDNPQPWNNDLPESVKKQLEDYKKWKKKQEKLLKLLQEALEELKKEEE